MEHRFFSERITHTVIVTDIIYSGSDPDRSA